MPQPAAAGKYYEDFGIGEAIVSARRTVSEGTIDLFAGVTGDFSEVHTDAELMKASEFGERIGHAILSLGVMQGLMWQTGYNRGTVIATLGWGKLRFTAPLRAGDTVQAYWTIKEKRVSRSRPALGGVVEECRLMNQRKEVVMTGGHVMLIRRRSKGVLAWRRPGAALRPVSRLPYAPVMARRAIGLSKSRVMAGLQCHKRLWWTVHEPAAPELQPDEALQAQFDEGTRVGEVARAYVPGGVLIDLPYNAYAGRIAATRAALQRQAPVIYEASFSAGRVFVSVDILERRPEGLGVIEVKSTTSVKAQHLPDVAVQAHVLRRSGVEASRLEIMHLNRASAYPDLSNLFTRADVTAQAHEALEAMPDVIQGQLAMLAGPLPDVAIGEHCRSPYECPFMGRCWPALPDHHVSTLHSAGSVALALEELGYATIHDLPEDISLKAIQDRQRRAVQAGQLIVEPGLTAALRAFQPPLAYLDFETVALPIPVWNGCHPYDAVPVQYSCHVEDAGGRVTHHEWLAEGPEDPRPALAERLIRACEPGRLVVAYNAGFERGCLLRMADALPALAGPLRNLADRLVDLLPLVRNHVYHPDFGGSFSLKSVLPAMVPDLRYDTLTIGEGETASLELERLLFQEAGLTPEAKAQLRGDLLRYCHQDTWGLVKLLERLRHLGKG